MPVRRPKPIEEEPLRAYAHRPPLASDPTRWAWRVVRHVGNRQISVKGAGGRYTRREMKHRLLDMVENSRWQAPEADPAPDDSVIIDTIGDLLDEWEKEQAARYERGTLTHGTLRSHRRAVAILKKGLSRVPLEGLTTAALQRWLDKSSYAPRTINLHLQKLRSAYTWGSKNGLTLPSFPEIEVPAILADEHERNHATPSLEDAAAVLARLPAGWPLITAELLRGTGARIGEIASLCWRDYSAGVLSVVQKGGKGKTRRRLIPVNAHLKQVLEQWRTEQSRPPRPEDRLLRCMPETIRRKTNIHLHDAALEAGVTPFTAHGLRRMASTALIQSGVSPKVYEEVMGHSYAMGLKIYAQADPGRMAEAVDVLAPASQPRGEVHPFRVTGSTHRR